MRKTYKPGNRCSCRGRYQAFTPSGDPTYTIKNMEEGKTFPATPFPGCYFILVN